MPSREQILQVLRESEAFIREHFRAQVDGIFGSYARGEETDESDVDILITPDEDMTMFDLVSLGDYLAEKLGRHVDILSRRVLNDNDAPQILNDLVSV